MAFHSYSYDSYPGYGYWWQFEDMASATSKMSSRGKFAKKANYLARRVQGTSNNEKSDVAKFATCSEPI